MPTDYSNFIDWTSIVGQPQPFNYITAFYISRLDYFTGLAMQALLSKQSISAETPLDEHLISLQAKSVAIAMINELDKPNASA